MPDALLYTKYNHMLSDVSIPLCGHTHNFLTEVLPMLHVTMSLEVHVY